MTEVEIAELEKRVEIAELEKDAEAGKEDVIRLLVAISRYCADEDKAKEGHAKRFPIKLMRKDGSYSLIYNADNTYFKGWGAEEDKAKAKYWSERLFEPLLNRANRDNEYAMFEVSTAYKNGMGVEVNPAEAKEWYAKWLRITFNKAWNGDTDAMRTVAAAYLFGKGVEIDYAKAVEWYDKWYETILKRRDPELVRAYRGGYGVEKNEEKAEFLEKIAELEKRDDKGDPNAMWNLAYEYGYGVERDEAYEISRCVDKEWCEERFPIVLKQAEDGNKGAMLEVSAAYLFGNGVEKNQENAQEWFLAVLKQ